MWKPQQRRNRRKKLLRRYAVISRLGETLPKAGYSCMGIAHTLVPLFSVQAGNNRQSCSLDVKNEPPEPRNLAGTALATNFLRRG
jgi:hypothetical protein